MSSVPASRQILRRKFNSDDQEEFAALSGDRNPLHIDPVAARRTLVGSLAVHGVHLALAALESLLDVRVKARRRNQQIAALNVRFRKAVIVGEEVRVSLEEETETSARLIGRVEGDAAFQVGAVFREGATPDLRSALPADVTEPLVDATLEQLCTAEGVLNLGLDPQRAQKLFPTLTSHWQADEIAEVLALTRLVGMRCPGLQSIFSDLDIQFLTENRAPRGVLRYRVVLADSRFRQLTIEVSGDRIEGQVTACVPLPPERQPNIAEVAALVPAGLFAGRRALIVGGSRGLGEVTAKILAAGGAHPVVTYYRGAVEAGRLADEIKEWGGKCEILYCDVRRSEATMRKLFRKSDGPASIYYFATPKISLPRRRFFNEEMLDVFNKYYVDYFHRLLDAATGVAVSKLRVLYPSSVFVTETPREMIEYAMAKRAGEELSAYYNCYRAAKAEIVVERLPRLKTDQTMSLLPAPVQDTLTAMLPIVKLVERGA